MKTVIVNCFDTYEERAENLRTFFSAKCDSVTVLTSDFEHFNKRRKTENLENQLLIHVPEYKRNLSIQRLKSHMEFSQRAVEELRRLQPDIIYAMIPPNSLVRELAYYKKENQSVKLVFDLIDLWPETMPIPFTKRVFPFSLWRKLRDKNIQCADYVFTECKLYQKVLADVLKNSRVDVLYLTRKDKPVATKPCNEDTLGICYLGSLNNIVDIDVIKRILQQLLTKYKVVFHIIGEGESKERLLADVAGLSIQVEDHGVVYDKKAKEDIFCQCDFGLNIMKKTVCVGLTMKSLDYFTYGLPLINNIMGDTYEWVESRGIGINVQDGGIINLEEIDKIKKDMGKVKERIAEFYLETFSYEAFCGKLDKVMATITEEI